MSGAPIVQFRLPRLAADAVRLDELRIRTRDRGLSPAHLETSAYRAGGGIRVTCHRPIAELLLEELRAAMTAATKQAVREACAMGISSMISELARIDNPVYPEMSDVDRGIIGL